MVVPMGNDVKRAEVMGIFTRDLSFQLSTDNSIDLKLYKRRWFILLLYVLYMTCNSVQWYQYSIISNVICGFYGVEPWAVDATSLVIMLSYLLCAVPVAYMMDKTDLRYPAAIGVLGTALGSWIKVFSAEQDRFMVTFAGQTLIALSQTFMLSVPPKLASIWFGEKEISTASSIGVFGNQLGLTVGFFLSPLMVRSELEGVAADLYTMFLTVATFTTFVSLVVLVYFKAEPPKPPTLTQAIRRYMTQPNHGYCGTFKRLFLDKHVMCLFLSTGVNNGCFNALLTLLNQIFISYFPNDEQDAGKIGVTIMVSGMAASMLFAHILDKTKRFKLITVTVYILSGVSVLVFALALESGSLVAVYAAAVAVGTFLCSFTAVSFDAASEVTYPESEVITATIMNMSSLICSIILTIIVTLVNNCFGFFWGNVAFSVILLLGGVSITGIKFDLRRLEAQTSGLHTLVTTPDDLSVSEKSMLESI